MVLFSDQKVSPRWTANFQQAAPLCLSFALYWGYVRWRWAQEYLVWIPFSYGLRAPFAKVGAFPASDYLRAEAELEVPGFQHREGDVAFSLVFLNRGSCHSQGFVSFPYVVSSLGVHVGSRSYHFGASLVTYRRLFFES